MRSVVVLSSIVAMVAAVWMCFLVSSWWIPVAVVVVVGYLWWLVQAIATPRPVPVLAVVGAVGLMIAASTLAAWGPRDVAALDNSERTEIVTATRDAVTSLMTFAPNDTADRRREVGRVLTGSMASEYRSQGPNAVLPGALDTGSSMTVAIRAAGVESVDGDTAVVLLFADQSITVPNVQPPQQNVSITRFVSMRHIDGRWLLADLAG